MFILRILYGCFVHVFGAYLRNKTGYELNDRLKPNQKQENKQELNVKTRKFRCTRGREGGKYLAASNYKACECRD